MAKKEIIYSNIPVQCIKVVQNYFKTHEQVLDGKKIMWVKKK